MLAQCSMLFPKHESRTSTQQPCDRVYVCSVHAHCLPYCHLKLHCRAFVISFRHYRVLMGVPTDHDLRCSQESSSYTCKVNKAPEPTSFCISFTSIVCSSPCRIPFPDHWMQPQTKTGTTSPCATCSVQPQIDPEDEVSRPRA